MKRRTHARTRHAGFTLVELMITIVIVSILASIAVPAYTHQIRKSRRTEARTALLELASREERFLAANNLYSVTATDLGYGSIPTAVGSGYYTMNVVPGAGSPLSGTLNGSATSVPTFTATATPVAGMGQDLDTDCSSFTVDSTGKQSSANTGGSDTTTICWQ